MDDVQKLWLIIGVFFCCCCSFPRFLSQADFEQPINNKTIMIFHFFFLLLAAVANLCKLFLSHYRSTEKKNKNDRWQCYIKISELLFVLLVWSHYEKKILRYRIIVIMEKLFFYFILSISFLSIYIIYLS